MIYGSHQNQHFFLTYHFQTKTPPCVNTCTANYRKVILRGEIYHPLPPQNPIKRHYRERIKILSSPNKLRSILKNLIELPLAEFLHINSKCIVHI